MTIRYGKTCPLACIILSVTKNQTNFCPLKNCSLTKLARKIELWLFELERNLSNVRFLIKRCEQLNRG